MLNKRFENMADAVRKLIEPVLDSEGKELVLLDFTQEHGRNILRLFVDNKEGAGIKLDEIATISRDIGALLDVEDAVPGSYCLEVSSPGLNRPLGKLSDCDRFAGKEAKVILKDMFEGRRKVTGILRGSENGSAVVECEDGKTVKIPWELIKKANLKGEFGDF